MSVGRVQPDPQQKHMFDHFGVGVEEHASKEGLDAQQERTLGHFRLVT